MFRMQCYYSYGYCCYLASIKAGERRAQMCQHSYFYCCYLASINAGERRAQMCQCSYFYCCHLASIKAGERRAQKCQRSYFYCCYLASVKAGERGAQNLQKVASSSEGIIHVMVVGVRVVTMPVQDVIPHIQTVSWNVGWGVPHAVKLVPKHTLCPAQNISQSGGSQSLGPASFD